MKQPVTQSDSCAAGGFGWGDPNWRKTSWSRCFIIPEIMRSGYHLIWSDIDVVWFRNPTEMLPLHPEVSDSRACKLGSWESLWSLMCNCGGHWPIAATLQGCRTDKWLY